MKRDASIRVSCSMQEPSVVWWTMYGAYAPYVEAEGKEWYVCHSMQKVMGTTLDRGFLRREEGSRNVSVYVTSGIPSLYVDVNPETLPPF